MNSLAIAKACLQAYVDKDRKAIEDLIAEDFRFTSPLDNGLDRAIYFMRCWPNSEWMDSATVTQHAEAGQSVFIVYEAQARGKRFRNCEMHTVRDGQLVAVEVYFGWTIPHPALPGRYVEQQGDCA